MKSDDLRHMHEQSKANAVDSFNTAKKMGGAELAEQFRTKLEDEIEANFIYK
jgi:hypothetical protein